MGHQRGDRHRLADALRPTAAVSGRAHLRARLIVVAVATVLASTASCGGSEPTGSPPLAVTDRGANPGSGSEPVNGSTTSRLAASSSLDAERATMPAAAAAFAQTVIDHASTIDPEGKPALAGFAAKVEGLEPGEAGGITVGPQDAQPFRGTVDVINSVPLQQGAHVICVVGGRQVDCAPSTSAWRVELEPGELARVPVELSAPAGETMWFLIVSDDEADATHVFTSSIKLFIRVGEPTLPAAVDQPEAPLVIEGCGKATLLDDPTPRAPGEPFRRLLEIEPDTPLFLVIQRCEPLIDGEIVDVVPIIDGSFVPGTSDPAWGSSIALHGPATVLRVPDDIRASGSSFQVAILRRTATLPARELPVWYTTGARFL